MSALPRRPCRPRTQSPRLSHPLPLAALRRPAPISSHFLASAAGRAAAMADLAAVSTAAGVDTGPQVAAVVSLAHSRTHGAKFGHRLILGAESTVRSCGIESAL